MTANSVSLRLRDNLERIIASTKPGDRLPSEPELSKQLGVSRATLREAMRTFEIQGMIRRRQGSGTYVNRPTQVIESGLEKLESIETMADRSGLLVRMGSWKAERRTPEQEISQILNIQTDQEVLYISRVILAEGRPVAYLVDYVPLDVLYLEDLQTGFNGSILDLLQGRGTPNLHAARTQINAVTASIEVARALGIQRGDALLSFKSDLFLNNGRIIDHSYAYFLPGYFRFHVVRKLEI